jgi:diguanylate cyclase (GGDEF)-like protein
MDEERDHSPLHRRAAASRRAARATTTRAKVLRQQVEAQRGSLERLLPGDSVALLRDVRPVFNALPSPAAIIGLDGRVRRVNDEWQRSSDKRLDLCTPGADYAASWPRSDGGAVLAKALTSLLHGEIDRFECEQSLDSVDTPHAVLIQMRALGGAEDRSVLVVHIDISVEREHDDQLLYQATHDPLTGVANRALLYHRLDQVIERAKRFGDQFALLYLDLDRFKDVNDVLGHIAGDALLHIVAQRWREEMRATDVLARVGGDEFVVLMERVTEASEPSKLADRLRAVIDGPIRLEEHEDITVSVSVGIASLSVVNSAEDAIAEADAQMYRVKRARSSDQPTQLTPGQPGRASSAPAAG